MRRRVSITFGLRFGAADPLTTFVFITTHTINDGELDQIEELGARFTELVEASDTGLLAFHFYVSDDATQVASVQVHRDAASMDAYLPVVGDLIGQALELSRTDRIDVYGTPGPVLHEVLRHNEEQGALVHVMSRHLDGFTHLAAAA
jgi:hypothetical protein